mmetsp:Transcript_29302/g.82663  ORF Transcript_29302/g.82663 Transcript_29302/m.82663 type:complete len:504 (+) Transcript_29302:2637-4148(+)
MSSSPKTRISSASCPWAPTRLTRKPRTSVAQPMPYPHHTRGDCVGLALGSGGKRDASDLLRLMIDRMVSASDTLLASGTPSSAGDPSPLSAGCVAAPGGAAEAAAASAAASSSAAAAAAVAAMEPSLEGLGYAMSWTSSVLPEESAVESPDPPGASAAASSPVCRLLPSGGVEVAATMEERSPVETGRMACASKAGSCSALADGSCISDSRPKITDTISDRIERDICVRSSPSLPGGWPWPIRKQAWKMLQTSLSLRYFPVGHLRHSSSTCRILDSTTSSEAWSVDSNLQCVTASAVLCIARARPWEEPAEEPMSSWEMSLLMEERAMAVMGPLVSAERTTSRKGVRYSRASTSDQSVQRKTFLRRALNFSSSRSSPMSSSVYRGITAHLLFCRMAVTTAAISVLSSSAFSWSMACCMVPCCRPGPRRWLDSGAEEATHARTGNAGTPAARGGRLVWQAVCCRCLSSLPVAAVYFPSPEVPPNSSLPLAPVPSPPQRRAHGQH